MTSIVHVEVSGLTGSGKSAVMGEIEIALKALGLKVEHGPDFQAEKNATHADWQDALDLYNPTVILTERNVSRQPEAREGEAVTWRTTCESLIDIVEGIGGIQHGTWRDDKGMCLKDTAAWAAFYVAARTAAPSADKLRTAVEASGFLLDRLSDLEQDVNERDFYGHVHPAASRLRQALAALEASA